MFKSKSSPGRETPPDITHTHSLAKFRILVLYYSWSHCLLQISVSSGRVSWWIPQSLLLTSSTGSTPRQSASSLSDMTKTFLYMQLRQVLTALNEMIWSLSSDSFNNTLHRECITLSLQRPSVSQTLPVHCLCLQTLNRRGCLRSAAGGGRRISLV